ncbi:S66 family peptidase [Floccifex sp.]|uniref:S66 family peptidase n=1 Tax=Floccifex sp. TaxID=2815810 RepID=UPI003F049666
MIIPEFLHESDCIGITASSCGILDKKEKYIDSINNIKKQGFTIKETENVYTNGMVSGSSLQRAKQFMDLIEDNQVKAIAIASGGDFLFDMLPFLDYEKIKNNPKWIIGSSDPTSLLFTITTNLNIQTIYSPCNMSGFNGQMHPSLYSFFDILKGKKVKQIQYDYCEKVSFSDSFDLRNEWTIINGPVDCTGTLIGGCIECLKDVIGTRFDHTKEFISQFDHMIWYFDVFNMSAESLYLTLTQFKNAGWFTNCNAILIGKVAFESSFVGLSYQQAIAQAIQDIPVIYRFDIGHVKPSFTMINGAKAHVVYNQKGYIKIED